NTLYLYFETNIYLNGLIIFLLSVSMFLTFYNNYKLYTTALFFKRIERVSAQDIIKDQEVNELHIILENDTPMLNTKQMHNSINNLKIFGHPNFSDNDARIIKSKLGYRIRLRRSDVSFNAGILVMLGLLGTFLGLLKTIDAVGEAMSGMSNLGGDGGEISADTMSNFIGSLSAPLQGMGLAFSSSLFGLSGSLMIGFFNHLCGGAQDNFIESASRWIDNRIPQFDPEKDIDDETNRPATEDDLKTWLAGFVHLSVKTNKQIASLSQAVLLSLQQSARVYSTLDKIALGQENMADKFDNTAKGLQTLNTQNQALIKYSAQSIETVGALKEASVENLSRVSGQLGTLSEDLQNTLNQSVAAAQNTQNILQAMLSQIEELKNVSQDKTVVTALGQQIMSVENTLLHIHSEQASLLENVARSQLRAENVTPHLGRLEALLEELNKKHYAMLQQLSTIVSSAHISGQPADFSELSSDIQELLDELDKDDGNIFKNFLTLGFGSPKK
ncbi:MAG TPA: hypothetical protein PLK94_08495, partial [Alphaproteobacteria bacterium]|nr:hypothetical protein [Alphaproteobacteria bacterium]